MRSYRNDVSGRGMAALVTNLQKILASDNGSNAFDELNKCGRDIKPENVSLNLLQLTQKLGVELFKSGSYGKCAIVCLIVIGWTSQSTHISRRTLGDALQSNTQSRISDSNLTKTELWARLTSLQAMVKDCEGNESPIVDGSVALIECINSSSKTLDAALLSSTAMKLKSLLFGCKLPTTRLLGLQLCSRLHLPYVAEDERAALSVIRGLRAKKEYIKEAEQVLELLIQEDRPQLCFDFGLWLLETCSKKRTKAVQFLCDGARSAKECMFAMKQASQTDMVCMHELISHTCLRGLQSDDADSAIKTELVRLHSKILYEGSRQCEDEFRLLIECMPRESTGDLSEVPRWEFEYFMRVPNGLPTYMARLKMAAESDDRSNDVVVWLGRALRILGKNDEALQVLSACHDADGILVRATVKTELGMDISAELREIFQMAREFQVVLEASYLAWNVGMYNTAVDLSMKAETLAESPQVSLVHHTELLDKRGSYSAELIHRYGDDTDTAIRQLLDSHGRLTSISLATENASMFELLRDLCAAAELLRTCGLYKLSKQFHKRALSTAKGRSLMGWVVRIEESLALLEATKGASAAIPLASNVDQDLLGRHYSNLMHALIQDTLRLTGARADGDSQIASQVDLAGGAVLDRFLKDTRVASAAYEQCRVQLIVERSAAKCLKAASRLDLLRGDALLAEAMLLKFESGHAVSPQEWSEAASRSSSDLLLLRRIYEGMLRDRTGVCDKDSKGVGGKQQRSTMNKAKKSGAAVKMNETKSDIYMSSEPVDAYLISSLVGLPVRSERALTLARQANKENHAGKQEDADLFHWHRMERVEDAARVQRAQVASRLDRNLVVCTISWDERTGSMYLCRTEKDGDVVVRWHVDQERGRECLDRFSRIMHRNLVQTDGSTPDVAERLGRGDKAKWWDARHELEEDLESWLVEFEDVFLSWRKVFLSGLPSYQSTSNLKEKPRSALYEDNSDDELDAELPRRFTQAVSFDLSQLDDDDALKSSAKISSPEGQSTTFKHIAPRSSAKVPAQSCVGGDDTHDTGFTRKNDIEGPHGKLAGLLEKLGRNDDLSRDIARICLTSNLDSNTIVQALCELLHIDKESASRLAKACAIDRTPSRKTLLLCLSGCLQQLPWESLPVLDGHPVSRVPSLPFCLVNPIRSKVEAARNWGFIVDPERNLARTEATLRPVLQRPYWQGVFGSDVMDPRTITDAFRENLASKGLFMYCGHGAGEEFFDRDKVREIEGDIEAACLLIGCSSANRAPMGLFEPQGAVDAYLVKGCPFVMGNLWNVTDKDIDRFTVGMLETLHEGPQDLVSLVARTRKMCKLKRLVGAAPVCFGLPLTI